MKAFLFLSDPIFWITFLLCFSVFAKKKKWKIVGLVFFAILTNNWLGYFALHLWESQTIQVHNIQEPYEIGIVLGPFIYREENKPNEELLKYKAIDRLSQAIELYKKGKFEKMLLSGGDTEMEVTRIFLLKEGIPCEDLLFEDQSSNTYENALFSKQLLDKKNYPSKRILLITSAYQMRRAKKCFAAVGLSVTPFSVDYFTSCSKLWDVSFVDIIPTQSAIRKWGVLIREWMSLFFFLLKGYISWTLVIGL